MAAENAKEETIVAALLGTFPVENVAYARLPLNAEEKGTEEDGTAEENPAM